MKKIFFLSMVLGFTVFSSCKDYLDVVPDNIATVDNAFSSRVQAEKSLFSCYSFLPVDGDQQFNPAMMGGDEMWLYPGMRTSPTFSPNAWFLALGEQAVTSPLLNYWDGENGGKPLYRGIHDCNVFIEKIHEARDMSTDESNQWKAEAMALKAYYHFYLLRMYGPIPIVDKNLPISSTSEQVRITRRPVDECVNYIVNTLDSAAQYLPATIEKVTTDQGRITKTIALAIKAKVLTMAASPLFNGNADFASLKNKDGEQLFNQTYDPNKWKLAMVAAKEAIDMAEANGASLFTFTPNIGTGALSPETTRLLSIQGAITEKWNSEIIWGLTNSNMSNLQAGAMARNVTTFLQYSSLAPTRRIVELFYSKNGVPITEDKLRSNATPNKMRAAVAAEKYYIKTGVNTAEINFDREPRFYADLGFDGGIWYGMGTYAEASAIAIQAKAGQTAGRIDAKNYSITGYWPKKLVHYQSVQVAFAAPQTVRYSWPVIRLADLYLMYAEAANELNGPGEDSYRYLDLIRTRAGLQGVVNSWANFSTNPSKPSTKDGLRNIIHQERMIEMAFEGSRFWDLRRWKEAPAAYNGVIKGWDVEQRDEVNYYREKVLATQTFQLKDYFWPIKDRSLLVNNKMVQNLGW